MDPRLAKLLSDLQEEQPGFMFLDSGEVTVHTRTILGETPLHVACVRGDVESGLLIISHGADIDAKGEYDSTPLMEAISHHCLPLAKALLEAGADVTPRSKLDYTALELAQEHGLEEIASLIMARLPQ